MNLGVLHPLDAVHAAEPAYRAGPAPLPAVEGFIRQILGWREYMWHLYWHFGPEYIDNNEMRANTAPPDWWAELDADAVTAECLRHALAGVRDRGWTHHIQRLMVLGNHALQSGYQPAELTEWFAAAFVDGFRWVMPTNVVGMSQHADGGRSRAGINAPPVLKPHQVGLQRQQSVQPDQTHYDDEDPQGIRR